MRQWCCDLVALHQSCHDEKLFISNRGEMEMRCLRATMCSGVLAASLILTMDLQIATAGSATNGPLLGRTPTVVAQRADDTSSSTQGSGRELPPGGMAIEDLLLQQGTITMDEWIQIGAGQEYRAAAKSRRGDAVTACNDTAELPPMLRVIVNFRLR